MYYNEAIKVDYAPFDHTNVGPTYYSTRLTGGTTNAKYGLTKTLSVMPGDVVSMEVYAKYLDPTSTNWTTALNNFMTAIANGTAPAGTLVDGGAAGSIGGGTYPISTIDHAAETGTPPKAYLNYIVLDRTMTTVLNVGYARITANSREYGQDGAHDRLALTYTAKEPGYIYIYLSNENPTAVEVYFDDFKIDHIKSPIIQMEDYYPFGLTFNSHQRENSVDQNYLYNGKELQDELDLGWLDYGARMYMPDIARWGTLDPLSEKGRRWSPYTYAFNNPTRFIDPEGMWPDDGCEGCARSRTTTVTTQSANVDVGGKKTAVTIVTQNTNDNSSISMNENGVVTAARVTNTSLSVTIDGAGNVVNASYRETSYITEDGKVTEGSETDTGTKTGSYKDGKFNFGEDTQFKANDAFKGIINEAQNYERTEHDDFSMSKAEEWSDKESLSILKLVPWTGTADDVFDAKEKLDRRHASQGVKLYERHQIWMMGSSVHDKATKYP